MRIVRTVLLFPIFASTVVCLNAQGQTWQVNWRVTPQFPPGVMSKVTVELLSPPASGATLQLSRSALRENPETLDIVIRPTSASTLPPSHVAATFSALGFRTQTLNSGLLSFRESSGSKTATVNTKLVLVPEALPSIEQIVALKPSAPGDRSWEIAVLNPSPVEISVTKIVMNAGYWGPIGCEGSATVYDITLKVSGETVSGQAKEQGLHGSFTYPIVGRLNRYCDDAWVDASVPLNLPVPARGRAYVKLVIREAEKFYRAVIPGIVFYLRSDQVDEIVRQARAQGAGKPLTEKALLENFRWTFGLRFNDSLSIVHGVPPNGDAAEMLKREILRPIDNR